MPDPSLPPAEPGPIPDPPATEPEPLPDTMRRHATVNELTAALCEAVGVDSANNQGFQLTVLGGQIPQLAIYPVHKELFPEGTYELADPWSDPLGQVMAPVTHALLPGGDRPEVQAPPELLPPDLVAPEVFDRAVAARLLPMMSDVINGAGCSPDMREWMTSAAHSLRMRFEEQVFAAAPPRQASPQRVAEAAAARDEAIAFATARHPELQLRREGDHVVLVLPGDAGVVHLPDERLWALATGPDHTHPDPPTVST